MTQKATLGLDQLDVSRGEDNATTMTAKVLDTKIPEEKSTNVQRACSFDLPKASIQNFQRDYTDNYMNQISEMFRNERFKKQQSSQVALPKKFKTGLNCASPKHISQSTQKFKPSRQTNLVYIREKPNGINPWAFSKKSLASQ